MEWDDLRFVLEVCRAGSALAASAALGVNQSTVMRRIARIEEELGVDLFERRQSGYRPTALGTAVADTARSVEAMVRDLGCTVSAARRAVTGTVRVTASETMANRLVVPCLPAFQKAHPGVRIEVIADDRRLDIAHGEADIALRAGSRPEGAGIVMRRMPDPAWSVYCSRSYAAEHGHPRSREEIRHHAVVGMDGPMARLPGPRWVEEAACGAEIRFRSNSLINLVSNLRAGLGVAALPCILADAEPDLLRCFPPPPELDSEFWLVIREDMKSAPHIRAVADFLATSLHAARDLLTGR